LFIDARVDNERCGVGPRPESNPADAQQLQMARRHAHLRVAAAIADPDLALLFRNHGEVDPDFVVSIARL
jgi:hypothetical protein